MKSQTIKYESYQLSNKSNAGNRIYENFHFLTIYVTKAGTVDEQIRRLQNAKNQLFPYNIALVSNLGEEVYYL